VDSSGLRFTNTNRLREYDAGILAVGVFVDGRQHIIPPNAMSFKNFGDCSADCLAKVSYLMKIYFVNYCTLRFKSSLFLS